MKYSNLSAEQKESMTPELREMFELILTQKCFINIHATIREIVSFQLAQKKEIEFLGNLNSSSLSPNMFKIIVKRIRGNKIKIQVYTENYFQLTI